MRSIHQFTNNPSGRPITIVLDTNDPIGNAVANNQYAYSETHEIFFKILKPGDRVIDLGGCIGTFSLVAAALGCHVVTVEASPRNAELIKASIAENNFHNMQVVCTAISDQPGTLEFQDLGPFGCVSNSHVNSGNKIIVPAMTMNQLLADLGWDTVDYIKMDIEGSEVAAIAGMTELLRKDNGPVIVYESNGHTLNFFDQTPNDLVAALENLGYSNYFWKEGALVLFRQNDFQAENLVDYLAFKRIPDGLQGLLIRSSLTQEEIIDEVISCCNHIHHHHRGYTARALARASHFILSNQKVINALQALARDSDPDVRNAVSCFEHGLLKSSPEQSEKSTDIICIVSSLAAQLAQAQEELEESRSLFRMIYGKWEQAMGELSEVQKSKIVQQIQEDQEEKEWLQSKYNVLKQTAQLLQTELKRSQLQLQQAQTEIERLQSQSKSIKFAGR